MAQWFFAPDQPLTARVAVNRYLGAAVWHWARGNAGGFRQRGRDAESSGAAGLAGAAFPERPELGHEGAAARNRHQRHLSAERARSTPALLEKDPRNRLLARGPQQRLTAEMVRDQALMASGLLTPTMGGPPVMPPQPAGRMDGRSPMRLEVDRCHGSGSLSARAVHLY